MLLFHFLRKSSEPKVEPYIVILFTWTNSEVNQKQKSIDDESKTWKVIWFKLKVNFPENSIRPCIRETHGVERRGHTKLTILRQTKRYFLLIDIKLRLQQVTTFTSDQLLRAKIRELRKCEQCADMLLRN